MIAGSTIGNPFGDHVDSKRRTGLKITAGPSSVTESGFPPLRVPHMFPGMPSKAVYLTSDAHLGASPPDLEAAFHRWLEFAAERAGLLLINGDLFDFWFEWGTVIPRGHTRVLGILARIVDSGVPVHLVGGNHDWWGGTYLTEEIGVNFHSGPVRLDLAGKSALVAHGDGLGGGDLGYRAMKHLLRSRLSRAAFRWIHPDWGSAIARTVSRTESVHGGPVEAHRRRSELLEKWARDRLLEDSGLDLVLLGHTHIPKRVEIAPGRFYLNSGDWIRSGTYVVREEGAPPALESWEL
jgi:UDP-2,3-diacylglucosamine hydrolase